METKRRKRTGEAVKGFGTLFTKVPQFADILGEERKNARTFINRPARYVFLAENIVTGEGEFREAAADHARRVHVVLNDENVGEVQRYRVEGLCLEKPLRDLLGKSTLFFF